MKKYSDAKTISQFGSTWKSKNSNASRRFTFAAGSAPHMDKFEELARNIALKRSDKLYSYNISRSLSEENDSNSQRRKLITENCVNIEADFNEKENTSNYKSNDIKTKSPTEKRRVSVSIGKKSSLAVSVDIKEMSANGDKSHNGSTHISPYQHSKKSLKSPSADRRKSLRDLENSENTPLTGKKPPVHHKNSKTTNEHRNISNKKFDQKIQRNGITEPNVKIGTLIFKQLNENEGMPFLKTNISDLKHSSDSESSSMVDNDSSYNGNISTDGTGAKLSPPCLEADDTRRKGSEVSSVSPVFSSVSSGSRKSSLSQRSELSMSSTTSTGSLAEKIIESRALKMREILRDRQSVNLEPQDFLPPNFSCRRFSVNSEGSQGNNSNDLCLRGFRSAASYPVLNSKETDQTDDENSLLLCQGKKKHLPDEVPKEGENSVPIRMYKRKHIRKVLEA